MRLGRYSIQRKKARIEIIPMIDTMFFLLVFFMIATLSMSVMRGMPVNLPRTDSAKTDLRDTRTLTITEAGRIFLDKKEATLEDVYTALRQDAMANPGVLVIINADEGARHGEVVSLMDAAKLAGVERLAIATKPRDAR